MFLHLKLKEAGKYEKWNFSEHNFAFFFVPKCLKFVPNRKKLNCFEFCCFFFSKEKIFEHFFHLWIPLFWWIFLIVFVVDLNRNSFVRERKMGGKSKTSYYRIVKTKYKKLKPIFCFLQDWTGRLVFLWKDCSEYCFVCCFFINWLFCYEFMGFF